MATVLPTAFIARQGARVRRTGGVLLVEHPDHPTVSLPIGQIGAVVALGRIEFTTHALVGLAEAGIGCALATRGGRLRAVVSQPSLRHVALRRAQHAIDSERRAWFASDRRNDAPGEAIGDAAQRPADSAPARACRPERALAIARGLVSTKIATQRAIVRRHREALLDAAPGGEAFSRASHGLEALERSAASGLDIDRIRGFEGAAAARYFEAMPWMCRGELTTSRRTRRPPRDEINAALSFGYALLVNEIATVLAARGLDPVLGTLHPPADGRPSLALDLVEPLRHRIVDRLVLRAANRRQLVREDFHEFETRSDLAEDAAGDEALAGLDDHADIGGEGLRDTATRPEKGVHLGDAGRSRFLALYHAAMTDDADAPPDEPPAPSRRAPGRRLVAQVVECYERFLLSHGNAAPGTREPDRTAAAGAPHDAASDSVRFAVVGACDSIPPISPSVPRGSSGSTST
jgi:CRISPR-associated protein Cas1